MKVGRAAMAAVRWLTRKVKAVRANKGLIRAAMATLKDAGVQTGKLEKYILKLEKVEATIGAHTSAWKRIEHAAKSGAGVSLPPAEVKYLARFKGLWDGFHKK